MDNKKKTSKAAQKAVHKYVRNNYDRFSITMPKGRKAALKECAEKNGYSINGFINAAINEKMQRLENTDNEQE